MQPWDKLEKGFQDSNRMQAASDRGFPGAGGLPCQTGGNLPGAAATDEGRGGIAGGNGARPLGCRTPTARLAVRRSQGHAE